MKLFQNCESCKFLIDEICEKTDEKMENGDSCDFWEVDIDFLNSQDDKSSYKIDFAFNQMDEKPF